MANRNPTTKRRAPALRHPVAAPGFAGQFSFPRGRWLRICTRGHSGALVPRNTWSALNADIQLERHRGAA